MTALTATHTAPVRVARPARARHLVSVPTGDAVPTPTKGELHLTRRGRLAITLGTLALATVTGAGIAFGGTAATPDEVVVEPGQTLTSIAAVELPGMATDAAIAEIRSANQLSTSHIHAGQTLVIPTP